MNDFIITQKYGKWREEREGKYRKTFLLGLVHPQVPLKYVSAVVVYVHSDKMGTTFLWLVQYARFVRAFFDGAYLLYSLGFSAYDTPNSSTFQPAAAILLPATVLGAASDIGSLRDRVSVLNVSPRQCRATCRVISPAIV